MTALPTLDPEIADLGLAIGLLTPGSGGGVELDSGWFDAPGERLAGALASDDRRSALVRFVDAVLAEGRHTERDGVVLLELFNLRQLAGGGAADTLPGLTVQVSLDSRPTDYVEVGLAASFATTAPATSTRALIPLYRAAKTGHTVSQPFALLAGGKVQVSTGLTLQPTPPPIGEFGLAGVAVAIETAVVGTPQPSFRLQLLGLHLPGAATASDIQVGGPGVPIEDALLSLVLGLVRQGADALSGAAAQEVGAALDLLGLGNSAGIPPLPVAAVLEHGVDELRNWFTDLMGADTARGAWLGALSQLLGGTVTAGQVQIPIGAGPVTAVIGLRAVNGPGGHLQVTPQLGLSVHAEVAGAIRLGAEASADLFTVDVATGSISPVPRADVVLTATGSGAGNAAKLLHNSTLDIGALRVGLSIVAGEPRALIEMRNVDIDGHHHDVLDLSSPDAVVAAVGQVAGDLVAAALDALGAAGADLKALLGLTPPAGVPPLDASQLLSNPLGTLQSWWHDLITNHAAAVPAVLTHLLNLVSAPLQAAQSVSGTGTSADPWSIPVANRLSLDCWRDGDRLVLAPTVSLRVGDLAAGCTTVLTTLRAELATFDLVAGHAQFLSRVDFTAKLRATGSTEARLSLGPVAVVADYLGVQAGWSAAGGFGVEFVSPNLAVDTGDTRVALVLPTVDAAGHLSVPPAAWGSVELLIGVLAASARQGWLSDLVDLTGWNLSNPDGPRLSLADLVASPTAALKAWLAALVTDGDLLGSLTATVAHLAGGTSDGLAGVFSGSGTPDDPWLASLGRTAAAPALAVWMGPDGPVVSATQASDAIRTWRPGTPGLGAEGLARALFDDALAGPDVALLAAGRPTIATGLQALADRWTGTDGLVGPPPALVPQLATVLRPERDASQLADVPVATLIPGGPPAGAVVVRVAVCSALNPTWTPAAGRLIDLTAPGLAPASFTVTAPASGDWVIALASRADTSLGSTDPSGVLGQAARLQQVLGPLATAGPVVLVALGGAGHAARIAADALPGVTHLVTLGTPWSPVTFDSARTGVPADAVRLLCALLPAVDPSDPDDADLALGRGLVTGFMDAARGKPYVSDLEAPRSTIAVRAGLTAVAVFGVLAADTVDRAITAVFAAGLSARARARYPVAAAAPDTSFVGVRVPFSLVTPPGGHGITVAGSAMLTLGSVTAAGPTIAAAPGLRIDLAVADTDGWLIGGPGTTPVGGALPLELRRLTARVDVGRHGQPSAAQVILGEGSALGADWAELVVRPPTTATGAIELTPLLPEAQALLTSLTTKLRAAAPASPAAVLLNLLRAVGVSQADGALVPDALAHLLHDPGGQLRSVVTAASTRTALLTALDGLIAELTVTADSAHLAFGPLTADANLVTGTIGFTATSSDGLLYWSAGASLSASGQPTIALGLGNPASDAFALVAEMSPAQPLRVQIVRAAAAAVPLWPTLDVDGLVGLAAAAVPAEALRLVLEGLRGIDSQLGTALDNLTSALGMLAAPDASGFRAIKAPLRLFDDPVGWFKQAGVLSIADGGPFDVEKVIDLLEGIKPFVGLGGTPRGGWPIVDGLQVGVSASAAGPMLSLTVDATSWLAGAAGHAPVAAGLSLGLAIPSSGAPRPSVEIFLGVPDGPGGTSTPQHRRAAHLIVDAAGLRLLLRPGAGSDIELFPNPAGFGSLLAAGATELLPLALNELAKLTGDATRTSIAALVTAAGRGLALASSATPAVFDKSALTALAADPPGYLQAHVGTLLTQVVASLDPLLRQVLSSASAIATVDGAGVLTVAFRTVLVTVHPAPFAVSVQAAVTGLPVVGAVTLSMSVDGSGLNGWAAGVGPAEIDLDGPVIRPFVRAGSSNPSGWQVELGLGLDDLPRSTTGHKELLARWREADAALTVLATNRTGPGAIAEDSTPEGVAVAAIDAVLDLVGGWVLGVAEVNALLQQTFGTQTVGFVLHDSILDKTAPPTAPRLLPGVLTGWPGKLFTIALQLSAAAPTITIDAFVIGLAKSPANVLGVSLSTSNAAGIDLTSGGEMSLHLEVDASWIEPPSGTSPSPGIVLNLLTVSGPPANPTFAITPGVEVNGVGLRLGKTTGPLIDAGLKLDTVAVHLFGSVQTDSAMHPVFAGGVQVELGGLAIPLGGGGGNNAVGQGIMHDAGGSGAPPRPKFSPAIAVQDHGTGVAVTLRAGSGDGPWFLPIQRAFGPVYLEQIGLGVAYRQGITPKQLQMISLYLDGGVSLLGLSASVDKLRLGYHVGQPFFAGSSWEVDVDGFAISSSIGGLTLAGGLRKFDLAAPLSGVEYLGMLKIGYGSYGLDLFGGYAHPTMPSGAQFASFFAFGVLHAPIGGPPCFFITGIGIGFGINRELHTPTIDQVNTHPFMQALRALGPAPEPMQQLQNMRAIVPPAQGQYWVAAGISFTSFVLISGEILVTVQFGDGLEIAILGLARAQLPTPVLTLVSIELALLARFSSKQGLLLVQAQLTENSWLLDKSVRLTGGFAFATWWKGPNAGQFVITVGGYHPRFHHDGYPVVPRVGLRWSPIDNISVVGGVYFALCSEALMAGAGIEVAAHFGPAHARLAFGGDAIVFFDPFWFSVRAYAEVDVGITIWLLFGSVDLELSFGVDVEINGPPIFVTGHFSVCGFRVPFEFGDQGDPSDRALDAAGFASKYLRGEKDAQVVQAAVIKGGVVAGKALGSSGGAGGTDKPPDGSAEHPFRVVPEFVLTYVTTAPSETVTVEGLLGATKSVAVFAPGLGVAPMYSATLNSTVKLTLARPDAKTFDIDGIALSARPAAAFPKGVWGPAQNPKAPTVPAGDTIDACDGMTIDTVLPDKAGAKPIDYHQIELPLGGRKPLPFVTNRANTDLRVSQAIALKNAAKILTAGTPGTAERFSRAALMLAAGGSGRTTVAALRGDRSASPSFGSLADDLVDSPAAVSTKVNPVVVDRSKPPPRRFAPIVKSVLGVPLSLSLDRPGGTTVADPSKAVRTITPTLASIRSASAGATQAVLTVVPRSAAVGRKTVSPTGLAPLTRLASGSLAAVANAQPTPLAADRLASMADQLLDQPADPTGAGRTGGGAVVHEGELAVITVANRPSGDALDTLVVTGRATRVLCLAAGGLALDDRVVGTDGSMAPVELPRATERVAVLGIGASAAAGGNVPGWCAGQSLPSVGWGVAMAGGAVVTAQATRIVDNRERADGGWVSTNELATAAQVVTVFTDPVNVIAVVIDDYLGGDAAGSVSMRLLDATRVLDAAGAPRPPELLVDGVRSILLYAVATTGPEPGVLVDGCGGGQLVGVLGGAGGIDALAAALAVSGVEAAVQQPLVGGPGLRRVTIALADGPVDKYVPRRAPDDLGKTRAMTPKTPRSSRRKRAT
jgi:hypothetical protein